MHRYAQHSQETRFFWQFILAWSNFSMLNETEGSQYAFNCLKLQLDSSTIKPYTLLNPHKSRKNIA